MFAQTLRQLINRNLTSLNEVRGITGRGNSTIYRWLNGTANPTSPDVGDLLKHLQNIEARKALLATVTKHLPVAIEWLDNNGEIDLDTENDRSQAQSDTVTLTIQAMDCLTDVLHHHHNRMNMKRSELTEEQYAQLAHLIDDAVRHLTNSKSLLSALVTKRKKARINVA